MQDSSLVSLDPLSPVPGTPVKTVKGSTCLSWEASFKEMAAENEDWSDFDLATCDGLAALAEEEMLGMVAT